MRPALDVTKDTIQIAYQLFLGRKASDAEINVIAASDISLPRLRNVFLNSREFKKSFGAKPANTVEQTPDRRVMIHLHIPKTAGSSLTRIIAPHFASGTQLPVSDGQLGALAAMPEKERRNASFVFGHLSHGMAHLLPQGHRYICVLRKPGARLLSYYNYLYRTTDHHSQKVVGGQKMSFGTFLEWAANPQSGHRNEVNNGQIRRLAGLKLQRDRASETELLPAAVKNIVASDMIFGLTEHFDHFVQRLHALGLIAETPDMGENMAPHPANLAEALATLTPDQAALYQAFTGWDDIFYNICEQLYFAQDMPKTGVI